MIKSFDLLIFLEKVNFFFNHVMIASFYYLNFYHFIALFIYFSTYSFNLHFDAQIDRVF
jgi:hypothetical protein